MELFLAILAIYGAILSTILGIIEIQKTCRTLKVVLQRDLFHYVLKLIIFNNMSRPIVIDSITIHTMEFVGNKKLIRETAPQNSLFDKHPEELFPQILNEGQQIVLNLNSIFYDLYMDEKTSFVVNVYDRSGKKYQISEVREFNEKFGYKEKVKNKFTNKTMKRS